MNERHRGWGNIAAVERETGLGKDTLRVWERRYGFPQPSRDENGDRLYPPEQVTRLRLIKRLMDRGHRPGKLVLADESELQAWSVESAVAATERGNRTDLGSVSADNGEALSEVFDDLVKHDAEGLRRALSRLMGKHGLHSFVLDIMPSLNDLVGEGWESGRIAVFEEHLYTEQMQVLLRQAIAALPPGTRRPRVLLTTVPEEQHVLGILMLESLLTLHGYRCVSLGTQTPLADIAAAVTAHEADAVALSFSAAFPARQVAPMLIQLRAALPDRVPLWVGGAGVGKGLEKAMAKSLPGNEAARSAENKAELPVAVCRSLSDALNLTVQLAQTLEYPSSVQGGNLHR